MSASNTAAELDAYINKLSSNSESQIQNGDQRGALIQQSYMARLLLAQGKYLDALPYFQCAMEGARALGSSSPENKFLWAGFLCEVGAELASTQDYLGDISSAEEIYQELLTIRPNGTFLGDYAIFLHRRKRDYVQAEAFYTRSLQLHPHQSSIHLKYAGFLRHVKKDLHGADAAYRRAIETNKTNADALGSYASFLHGALGKIELAGEMYEQALKQDTFHANNLCNYGLFLSEERGNYGVAEDLYKRALQHSPKHANTLYNYAVMLDTHCKRKDEAEELYRRCLEVEPRHAFALYNLAVLLDYQVGAKEKADDKALKQSGQKLISDCDKASRLERRAEVASLYERAVDCDPKDPTTTADYGRYLLTKMENVEAAEAMFFKAIQLDSENAVAIYNLALLMHKHKGNFAGAEGLLLKLAAKSPPHASSLHQLGRVYLDKFKADGDQRDLENSIKYFEKAVEVLRDPSMCMMEYCKVVSECGSSRQKTRAISYMDSVLGRKKVGRETDIRSMTSALQKLQNPAGPNTSSTSSSSAV